MRVFLIYLYMHPFSCEIRAAILAIVFHPIDLLQSVSFTNLFHLSPLSAAHRIKPKVLRTSTDGAHFPLAAGAEPCIITRNLIQPRTAQVKGAGASVATDQVTAAAT